MRNANHKYILFKNKNKIINTFLYAEIGKLAKIFIPSEWRTVYWDNEPFVHGMILGKKTYHQEYVSFYEMTILIKSAKYRIIWLHRLKKNQITMFDISLLRL